MVERVARKPWGVSFAAFSVALVLSLLAGPVIRAVALRAPQQDTCSGTFEDEFTVSAANFDFKSANINAEITFDSPTPGATGEATLQTDITLDVRYFFIYATPPSPLPANGDTIENLMMESPDWTAKKEVNIGTRRYTFPVSRCRKADIEEVARSLAPGDPDPVRDPTAVVAVLLGGMEGAPPNVMNHNATVTVKGQCEGTVLQGMPEKTFDLSDRGTGNGQRP